MLLGFPLIPSRPHGPDFQRQVVGGMRPTIIGESFWCSACLYVIELAVRGENTWCSGVWCVICGTEPGSRNRLGPLKKSLFFSFVCLGVPRTGLYI